MVGRRWTLVVALAVIAEPVAAQSRKADPRAIAIDSIVRTQVDSGFTGVVLIAIGDKVILHRAYNARDARPVVDTTSKFWIGSMTKGFTAAAIMRLQEQRRLSIDDSISKFFRNVPNDKRAITIRQLLTHTSRLPGTGAAYSATSRNAAVDAILAEPLTASSESAYRYTDDNYELLAAIVEIVSRKRWEDYLRSELIVRAGLKHTGFWRGNDWGHRGGDGMSSTARDLLRWARALDSGHILSASSRAALRSPQVFVRREGASDVSYGFGVRVYTVNHAITEVMHAGSSDEGNTGVVRIIGSTAIVVLSNAGQHGGTTWSSYVAHRFDGPLVIAPH